MSQQISGWINQLLERLNHLIGDYPGFLPIIGIVFIVLNFILQLIPGPGVWIVDSNLFLHIGLIVALFGILLIRPLS